MWTPSARPIAPFTAKTSHIAPNPFAMSTTAGHAIVWPWNEATTTLEAAPTTNRIAVKMPIQASNATTRPNQVVMRPGPWVKVVFTVPQEYSDPAINAPSTIAIAAPSGKPAPMTLLTNWSG